MYRLPVFAIHTGISKLDGIRLLSHSMTHPMTYESSVLVNIQRLVETKSMSLDSVWGIQSADERVQGPDEDVTLVLVLTTRENICLLNYANVAEVVSTFSLTRGGAQLRRAANDYFDKVFKAFVNKVSQVCRCSVSKSKEHLLMLGRHLDEAFTRSQRGPRM